MQPSEQDVLKALLEIQRISKKPYQTKTEKNIGVDSLSFYLRVPINNLLPVLESMQSKHIIAITDGKKHHHSGRVNMRYITVIEGV